MRVLLIEDNTDIAANICDYLEGEGHDMDHAMDGVGGLHLALTQSYDVLILDVMLPAMDGLTLCEKLRTRGTDLPVLMLTARDTLPDKLAGFEAGTDDYLVKPFALQELHARVKALGMRGHRKNDRVLRLADLELNLGTMTVKRGGSKLELNQIGIRILACLMEAAPNLVTRGDLIYHIWQDFPPGSDALRSHMYNLRQVIDKPFDQPLLHTVRGVGYRMVNPDESSS